MKRQLMLAALALSIGAASAQPPDNVPIAKPPIDWQQWQREQEEKARRAPDTMLHHFVSAIGSGDYEAAANDVLGADNDPWVRSLKDKMRRQTSVSLEMAPLFAAPKADQFTARVATSVNIRESPL